MAEVLWCCQGEWPIPFLGLSVGGRIKRVDGWREVVDKFRNKLRRWNVMSISMGGRATLIQSSLSSIPLYWLSLLPLPKSVEKEMRSIMCNFLWGGSEDIRKTAWLRWDEICKSKMEGGLGIKDLLRLNRALLCKWVWRFEREKERLWARFIQSRHGEPQWSKGIAAGVVRGRKSGWWSNITALVSRTDSD